MRYYFDESFIDDYEDDISEYYEFKEGLNSLELELNELIDSELPYLITSKNNFIFALKDNKILINNLIDKIINYDFVNNTINTLEYDLYNLKNILNQIIDKIDDVEDDIYELSSKIEEIDEKKEEINAFKSGAPISSNLTKYFKAIEDVKNKKNIFIGELNKNIKTTELLDGFYESKNDFLILRNQFYLDKNKCYISMILTNLYIDAEYINEEFTFYNDIPTFTELKNSKGKSVFINQISRMNDLASELIDYDLFHEIKTGDFINLSKPYIVGGQNKYNRIGYGNIYSDGILIKEGTKYGEVSYYFVLGFFAE